MKPVVALRLVATFVATFLVASCVSTHMARYVDRDIRDVIVDSGPPIHQLDMGEGLRGYQFRLGGGTYFIPQSTTTSGTASTVAGVTQFQASSYTAGGGVVHSEGCVITYITRWSETRNGWIVVDYRYPDRAFC